MRHLVEEALDGEDVLVRAGRAPEPHRQVRVLDQSPRRACSARCSRCRPGRRRPAARLYWAEDALPTDAKIDEVTTRIDHAVGMPSAPTRGLEGDHRVRTEFVLAGVLFARPDKLHRPLHRFGDGDGLLDLVVGVAAAETAADEAVVDIDLLRLQAGGLGRRLERLVRRLRSEPDIEPVGLQMHRRVHRLHRRMRQIGRLVDRLEGLCRARHGLYRHCRRCARSASAR